MFIACRVANVEELSDASIVAANLALPVDIKSVATAPWGIVFALTAAYNVFTIYSRDRFGNPWGLASTQLLVASAYTFITKIRKAPAFTKDQLVKLLPSCALLALGSGLAINAYSSGAGFVNTFKLLGGIITVILAGVFDKAVPTLYSTVAMVAAFLGVMYSCNGNLNTGSMESLLKSQASKYALGSMTAFALRAKLFPAAADASSVAYDNLLAALVLVPVAIKYEGKNVFKKILDSATGNLESLAYLVLSGLALVLLEEKAVVSAGEAGALGNAVNKVATFAAIRFIVNEGFNQDRTIGIAAGILGSLAFDVYSARKI
jgi:hypothetical protein